MSDTCEVRTLSHNERLAIENGAQSPRTRARGARGKHGQAKQSARERLSDPRGKDVKRINAPTAALREYAILEDGSDGFMQIKLGVDCEVRIVTLRHAERAGRREFIQFCEANGCHPTPFGSLSHSSEYFRSTTHERFNVYYCAGPVTALDTLAHIESKLGSTILLEWRYATSSRTGGSAVGEGKASISSARRIREGKREQIDRAVDRILAPTVSIIGTVPGNGIVETAQVRERIYHREQAAIDGALRNLGVSFDWSSLSPSARELLPNFYGTFATLLTLVQQSPPPLARIIQAIGKLEDTLPGIGNVLGIADYREMLKSEAVAPVRMTEQEEWEEFEMLPELRQWAEFAGATGEAKRIAERDARIATERHSAALESWIAGERNIFTDSPELDFSGFPVPEYHEQPKQDTFIAR